MKYFSNLKNGWADLTIGKFYCRCSYVQDIPMEILCAYEEFEKNRHCIITIDSEGYENEIIITDFGVHIFIYRNKIIHYDLSGQFDTHIKKLKLLKGLFEDIVCNIDKWAKWMCFADSDEKSYKKYKEDILRYAEKL